MKTISILGSGWLGLPLAKHLVRQGYEVKASTRTAERFEAIKACAAKPFVVDIDHLVGDVEIFLQADILIINITSKNTAAFKSLISKIKTSPVKKVIFVSSTSVYKNTNGIVSESDNAEDINSALYQIECLFRSNHYFQTTVVRFAGLIGYNRHPGRFFGGRKIPQPDAPVNLIHRDDCISILDKIIQREVWGEVFNACSDTHPSKRDFYSYASSNLGLLAPEFERTTETKYKIISNEKIKQLLEYRFIHADLLKFDL